MIIGKVSDSVTGSAVPTDSGVGMELALAGHIPTLYQSASNVFICEQ